jgi:ABC-type phosphate transport system substrate-binding protein
MQVRTFGKAMGVSLTAVLAVAAMATPALADPTSTTDYRALAGVGSDTTQDVMNGLAEAITDADGNKILASWDARGSDQIKTKATGCEFARPNGSTAGRTALKNAKTAGNAIVGCVDFARSSSSTTAVVGGSGTWIPFGVDAMTYAINENSDLPDNLTDVQLQRIYQCLDTDIAGTPVTPLLIQSGSGTRSFWNTRVGITESEIAAGDYPCLEDLDNTVQEHTGEVLTGHNEYILPYSIAQFVAQGNAGQVVDGVTVNVLDRRGPALLGSINGVAPTVGGNLNVEFPNRRDVYNIVASADLTVPVIESTFVGATSAVCSRTSIIQAYGFGASASCGDTTLRGNL